MGSAIEILALRALAEEACGDMATALATLGRALALAEPEGYVRLFVDEGMAMMALLRRAAAEGLSPAYAHRLLAAAAPPGAPAPPAVARPTAASPLPESLTPREREVLELLAAGAQNGEIAARLYGPSTRLRSTSATSSASSAWATAPKPWRGRARWGSSRKGHRPARVSRDPTGPRRDTARPHHGSPLAQARHHRASVIRRKIPPPVALSGDALVAVRPYSEGMPRAPPRLP